jgi:hypothetical protein
MHNVAFARRSRAGSTFYFLSEYNVASANRSTTNATLCRSGRTLPSMLPLTYTAVDHPRAAGSEIRTLPNRITPAFRVGPYIVVPPTSWST